MPTIDIYENDLEIDVQYTAISYQYMSDSWNYCSYELMCTKAGDSENTYCLQIGTGPIFAKLESVRVSGVKNKFFITRTVKTFKGTSTTLTLCTPDNSVTTLSDP